MRTLPSGVSTVVAAEQYRAVLALEIGTTVPVRIVSGPSNITIGGETFVSGAFTLSSISVGDGDSGVSITTPNLDNSISTLDISEGLLGKTVKVYEVHYSAVGAQLDAITLHYGYCISVLWDAEAAEIQSQQLRALSSGMCGRIASRTCRYIFGGTPCGYSGSETRCDHTHKTCTELGNEDRFGGLTRLAPQSGDALVFTAPVRTGEVRPQSIVVGAAARPGGTPPGRTVITSPDEIFS
jgi:hypothetical protein